MVKNKYNLLLYLYNIFNMPDIEEKGGQINTDILENWKIGSSERREAELKRKQEIQELSDEVLASIYNREIADLKNDYLVACLREKPYLYKDYVESVKQDPSLKKYFQKYTFKGKDFLIVPVIDNKTKKLHIKTYEVKQKGDNTLSFQIDWMSENMQEAIYDSNSRYANLVPVNFPVASWNDSFTYLYMNKWTWVLTDKKPYEYKMDKQWVRSLMSTIEENWWAKISECSEWLQSTVEDILLNENELDEQAKSVDKQRIQFYKCIMEWDISWAISWFLNIITSYFTRKERGRVIDIGKGINYEWDERDVKYLESAIATVLEPEKRSELTYLLSKIKDKHMKESLKEKWLENPSQFDLFLQQCEPGQIMLTNALDLEWWSSSFKFATQAVSWARRCHALIIEDVIKDNDWRITDAKIIQSTLKWGVHETTLKKYISENYSSSDLLLANVPEDSRKSLINSAKSKIGQKYDKISIVTDSILWDALDWFEWWIVSVPWKNKAYCSELVFDAMEKSWIRMPEPHMSPSDLLLSDEVSPQYTCYCDKF